MSLLLPQILTFLIPIIGRVSLYLSHLHILSLIYKYKFNSPLYPIPLNLIKIISHLIISPSKNIIHTSLISSTIPKSLWNILNSIVNDIICSIDAISSYLLLFLDLSSAFYTLDHYILSHRLKSICIHGQVHAWCMSYLPSRASSIHIDKSLSIPFDITSGIAQGSVLGPLLFIIYIILISSILSKYPHI